MIFNTLSEQLLATAKENGLNIPALCQAIDSIVLPRIEVWSKSSLVIPQTTGFLEHCLLFHQIIS